MKLKLSLRGIEKSLVIRLPRQILEEAAPSKVSLNKIIEDKMQFFLNAIYAICIDDIKEQEKRRKLIRLYTKEMNELIKILTLILSSKHGAKIDYLERKVLKLQKYNKEQEELADLLVYKCNDLKLEVPSSYDISRAVDVLLQGEVNFPAEVLRLSKALTKEDAQPTEFQRVDQLLGLHIQRSGIWRNKHVSYTVNRGVVELESYGFKSTLTMESGRSQEWRILSVKDMEGDMKNVSMKGITLKNPLMDLVNMTKYAHIVLQIEEVYKLFKRKIESKIFDMEISGTSKEFTVDVLGAYKAQFGISSNWDGPILTCHLKHGATSVLFKENVLENLFAHIDACLKNEYTENASISIEKGVLYKEKVLFTMRELHKEASQDRTARLIAAPGVVMQERVNIMCEGDVINVNAVIRMDGNMFLGVMWNAQKTSVRLFYGVFQMCSILVGNEISISPFFAEGGAPSPGAEGARKSSPKKDTSEETSPVASKRGKSPFVLIETTHTPEQLIQVILQKPIPILTLISSYSSIKDITGVRGKLHISDEIEMVLFDSVLIHLGDSKNHRIHCRVISRQIHLEGDMLPQEIQKVVWLSVMCIGAASSAHIFLPEFHRKVQVSGKMCNIQQSSEEIALSKGLIEISLSFRNGQIFCTSAHPLVSVWAMSIINAKSRRGLCYLFFCQDVLVHPGLVSTLHIHNTLGGSLDKTCGTSIVYMLKENLEVRWEKPSKKIADALQSIPKIKEDAAHAVMALEHLPAFLKIVSKLFSEERVAKMGNVVKIQGPAGCSVYRIEARGDGLVSSHVEGAHIKEARVILERGPDPYRLLLEQNLHVFPE
ncbi:uncharacterized protein NEMAJ01_0517 [Nematocida major]|uniref:uncharacterized protein n=1 Tax=Nematocida major TaxID=1912982 RepID=UPI002008E823|nr:uncharacterized protein NEMAJ01_0517 [Nematocida major]KAH9385621.1 hypothetical protein NEMAJ01_0517 [Nematocida major]